MSLESVKHRWSSGRVLNPLFFIAVKRLIYWLWAVIHHTLFAHLLISLKSERFTWLIARLSKFNTSRKVQISSNRVRSGSKMFLRLLPFRVKTLKSSSNPVFSLKKTFNSLFGWLSCCLLYFYTYKSSTDLSVPVTLYGVNCLWAVWRSWWTQVLLF